MRKHTKTIGALAAASAFVAGYASAEIKGEVHVGYSTEYEFRFVDLGSDLIEAGADISYDWSDIGVTLSAGAWYGSVNDAQDAVVLTPSGAVLGNHDFNELDLYAAVAKDIGPVNLELGVIWYTYQDTPTNIDTTEIYLGATYKLPWDLSLSGTFYWDVDSASGWYFQPELAKSFKFNDCLALNLSTGVGFADGNLAQARAGRINPGSTADGFQGWFVKAELPWSFRENVTLAPYIKYADADDKLAGDINSTEGGQEHLLGGVKLTVGF